MRWLAVVVVAMVAGCGSVPSSMSSSTGPTVPKTVISIPSPPEGRTVLVPSHCLYRRVGAQVLPDQRCTPGATDQRVTPATVASTICRAGYSASVRPPVSVTDPLKRALMRAYGATGPPSAYELDHLIALEDGGAPASPANLWPQPLSQARVKDALEGRVRRAVCAAPARLRALQHVIAGDWPAVP